GCSTGQLPGYVIGRPQRLAAGATAGDYVWHNDRGWEIAVTHPGNDEGCVHRNGACLAADPIRRGARREERGLRQDSALLARRRWSRTVTVASLSGWAGPPSVR